MVHAHVSVVAPFTAPLVGVARPSRGADGGDRALAVERDGSRSRPGLRPGRDARVRRSLWTAVSRRRGVRGGRAGCRRCTRSACSRTPSRRRHGRSRRPPSGGAVRLVSTMRVARRKRPLELLRIFERVRRRGRRAGHLTVVGDGPLRHGVERLARRMDLDALRPGHRPARAGTRCWTSWPTPTCTSLRRCSSPSGWPPWRHEASACRSWAGCGTGLADFIDDGRRRAAVRQRHRDGRRAGRPGRRRGPAAADVRAQPHRGARHVLDRTRWTPTSASTPSPAESGSRRCWRHDPLERTFHAGLVPCPPGRRGAADGRPARPVGRGRSPRRARHGDGGRAWPRRPPGRRRRRSRPTSG